MWCFNNVSHLGLLSIFSGTCHFIYQPWHDHWPLTNDHRPLPCKDPSKIPNCVATFIFLLFFPVSAALLTDPLIQVIHYNLLIYNLALWRNTFLFIWMVKYLVVWFMINKSKWSTTTHLYIKSGAKHWCIWMSNCLIVLSMIPKIMKFACQLHFSLSSRTYNLSKCCKEQSECPNIL